MLNRLSLINLNKFNIIEQLRLEEALLRTDQRNICLIHQKANPAIVMGVSTSPEEVLNVSEVKKNNIPVIKRFSGGGTVYIDENTLLITFIFQRELFKFPLFPKEIMEWSEQIYMPVFEGCTFSLRENDYTLGEKKIGGNAQSLLKDRFLHHTSFLWNFDPQKMNCLLIPKKQPKYRQNRSHESFLSPLAPHFPSQEVFIERLKNALSQQFCIEPLSYEEACKTLDLPHRKTTTMVEITTCH